MNKTVLSVLSLLSLFNLEKLQATTDQLTVTGRVSYLSFTRSPLKELYHSGPYYEISETIPAAYGLHGWMAIGYFQKSGHSGSLKTELQLVPITLGPKFLYQCDWAVPYVGIGVRALYTYRKNQDPLVRKHISKWGPGAVAEVGSLFLLNEHLFIDSNAGYSYAKVRASMSKTARTSPLTVEEWHLGLGIGYKF